MPALLTQLPWAKIGVAFAIAAALWLYGHGKYMEGQNDERSAWAQKVEEANKKILALNIGMRDDKIAALEADNARTEARKPIILHNTEIVHDFAATPAGAANCLSAERVFGIEATAAQLGFGNTGATATGN